MRVVQRDVDDQVRKVIRLAKQAKRRPRGNRQVKLLDQMLEQIAVLIMLEDVAKLDRLAQAALDSRVVWSTPIAKERIEARVRKLQGESGLVLP